MFLATREFPAFERLKDPSRSARRNEGSTDAAPLAATQKGEFMSPNESTHTFELFYLEHRESLWALARRSTKTAADAQDLFQRTVERAFVAFSSFTPGTSGYAWLALIMRRLQVDEWRRARRMVVSDVESLAVASAEPEPEPWWLSLDIGDIEAALETLPEPSRSLFQQRLVRGHSYARIAADGGTCRSTVGTRLVRARSKLKQALIQRHGGDREPAPRPVCRPRTPSVRPGLPR